MKFSLLKLKTFHQTLSIAVMFIALALFLPVWTAFGQSNPQMNYQGKLTTTSGSAVSDGLYNMRFWLIGSSTAATSSAEWAEELTGSNRVMVANGLFSIMLGSTTPLSGVDFDQTLYLGVEIGGTGGSPLWDGEMSPRKILGTVPAAFVATTAGSADSLSGIASSSFLRSDEADTMTASSTSPILTLVQNGVGKVASFFSGITETFSVLSNGRVGVNSSNPEALFTVQGNNSSAPLFLVSTSTDGAGTTTPFFIGANGNVGIGTSTLKAARLTVDGGVSLSGALLDSTAATGTLGMVLQTTGTSTRWVATSTLGISAGASTFLSLTDTPSSYTANRILFTNSGATAVTDSASFVFNGTNLGLGSSTPGARLSVEGAAGNSDVFALASSTGSILFKVLSNGNVGIGTTSPSHKLSVAETASFGNLIVSTSTGVSTIFNRLDIGRSNGAHSNAGTLNIKSLGSNTAIGLDNDALGESSISFNNGTYGLTLEVHTPGVPITIRPYGAMAAYFNDSGNVGIGTSTLKAARLTVDGGVSLSGALLDSTAATGTLGMVLQTTGTSTRWVATSTLGISAGASTFLSLTDTPSSYTANRILFTNSGATAVTDSASFVFNGTNLGLGSSTPGARLSVEGAAGNSDVFIFASSTGSKMLSLSASGRLVLGPTTNSDLYINGGSTTTNPQLEGSNIAIGNQAFVYSSSTSPTLYNIALGHQALLGSSTARMTGGSNFAAGYQAMMSNISGVSNNSIGVGSLKSNLSGSYNTGLGTQSLFLNISGSNNVAIGTNALLSSVTASFNVAIGDASLAFNTTGASSTAVGAFAGFSNQTGSYNLFLGDEADSRLNDLVNASAIGSHAKVGQSNSMVLGGTGAWNTNIVTGTSTPWAKFSIQNSFGSTTALFDIATTTSSTFATSSLFRVGHNGKVGIGTTTHDGTLAIERIGLNGNAVAGIDQYLTFSNSTASAIQYGNRTYFKTTNTATTTLVGSILMLEDSTTYGNTTRGLEVQTERGTNTQGENTAISGFARTFGVRGVTEGDAGGIFEPAGVYGETRGTTQGNAIRGYSSTITSAALLKLFQDTSVFNGTGLLMNFGNSGGSFSSTTASKFIDFQNAGTSRFTVGAYGMLTIGDGTTGTNAGLQVGYGGICVDDDGSCNASTTGRISSVSTATGNSDLAEMYFSDDGLEPGEVVYLEGGLSVGRANLAKKDLVIGVVSTLPGLIMGENDASLKVGEVGYPIALKGRVPVKVSNENGEVKKGDELMLSSVPGVVMKASSTGIVVGIALEDYEETRAYSETFINQFGESIIVPDYTPINRVSDARINDGCYYGGGNASGDTPCVPLRATTTAAQYDEADTLIAAEAKERALKNLARVNSEREYTVEGEAVLVGQIVMFVDLRYRYLDAEDEVVLDAISSELSEESIETVWSRLVELAENFVDGVLSVFTLRANRVETDELCLDDVCVTASELQELLNESEEGLEEEPILMEPEPEPEPEEEGEGEQDYVPKSESEETIAGDNDLPTTDLEEIAEISSSDLEAEGNSLTEANTMGSGSDTSDMTETDAGPEGSVTGESSGEDTQQIEAINP